MQVTCLSLWNSTLGRAVVVAGLATALLTTSCSNGTKAPPSGSATASTVWLCQPGRANDPCADRFSATAIASGGARSPAAIPGLPAPSVASQFNCFYVYPTVSEDQAGNTGLAIQKVEIDAAAAQGSPFTPVCNVWAPMYRSETVSSVDRGLAGDTTLMSSTFNVAYESVLSAWNDFVAHDDQGKPIILIGDSQGSAILIHLISTDIEHDPAVLGRLLVAIIVGGNLQVPAGRAVGATFARVPLCTSTGATGCAIAFSAYPSQPVIDSLFGRPGQGVSLQSGQSETQGQQVACVNPAALNGGAADLDPYFPTVTQTTLDPKPTTPWVGYPGLYTARCENAGGATWLQVTSQAGPGDTRPLVNESVLGPEWGYHLDEFGLTLGNLVHDVAGQEAAWTAAH